MKQLWRYKIQRKKCLFTWWRQTDTRWCSSKSPRSFTKGFNLQGREGLDARIARMFFSSRLPFHLVGNPYYRRHFLMLPILFHGCFFIVGMSMSFSCSFVYVHVMSNIVSEFVLLSSPLTSHFLHPWKQSCTGTNVLTTSGKKYKM